MPIRCIDSKPYNKKVTSGEVAKWTTLREYRIFWCGQYGEIGTKGPPCQVLKRSKMKQWQWGLGMLRSWGFRALIARWSLISKTKGSELKCISDYFRHVIWRKIRSRADNLANGGVVFVERSSPREDFFRISTTGDRVAGHWTGQDLICMFCSLFIIIWIVIESRGKSLTFLLPDDIGEDLCFVWRSRTWRGGETILKLCNTLVRCRTRTSIRSLINSEFFLSEYHREYLSSYATQEWSVLGKSNFSLKRVTVVVCTIMSHKVDTLDTKLDTFSTKVGTFQIKRCTRQACRLWNQTKHLSHQNELPVH